LRVVGERVERGEPLAVLHARSSQTTGAVLARARAAFSVGARAPGRRLVLARVDR
jgi:thymidine phosphorylase